MRLGQEERMMAADVVSLSRDLRDRLLEERLRVVESTRGRFQGRKALEQAARRPYDPYRERASALADLERMLGLIDDAERDERIVQAYLDDEDTSKVGRAMARALATRDAKQVYELVREYAPAQIGRLDDVECVREIRRKRAERARARSGRDEYPAERESVLARLPRWREARYLAAQLVSVFRCTTHGHETTILPALRGREGAASSVELTSPNRLDSIRYPNAYRRQGGMVRCSKHIFRVSTRILDEDTRRLNAGAPPGVVYLSAHVRVRQGVGTSLVVERV
jgi:hypothetical protein